MKHNAKGGTIDDITLQPPGAPQQVTVTRADVQATEAVWRTDQLRGLTRAFSPSLVARLLSEESRTSCDETWRVGGVFTRQIVHAVLIYNTEA